MKALRIFISSPGDVAEERDRARQVVEQLRRRYAGQFDLKAVLWEDLPLQADVSFQQGIDLVLSREQGVDIAVFILWSRLGSPLGALIRKPDGSTYRSGTERELDLMLAARRQNQRRDPASDAPKILLYTRKDEASFDERLRGQSTDEKNQLIAQKKLVETFIQEEFHDATGGTNVRAYHSFDRPATFSQRLRAHLQEMLDPLAASLGGEPVWDIGRQGSPFRGLEAFEPAHSAVFFGREDEVLEVRRALQKKARDGCAFVLISGASGSGKSSLARAGVLPAIVEHEVDGVISGWRWAVLTPEQLEGRLCEGLARLLCAEGVLPELRSHEDSVRVLAEGLATAPKQTVDQSVRPGLARAGQSKRPASRLLLVVDQLEELFTDKRLTEAERGQFVAVLEALARSGVAWVLATVRSDFYQHCQRLPGLMRMKEGPGQTDLLAPSADALRRLIEQPARLAGLSFQQREGAFLADRILADATVHAELLPLVSYVLRELFEQRTPQGILTFATYEQLGGVEGALAKRAESVFKGLPAAAQGELSAVLRALVSVSGDEEESVVRQRVALATFPAESPARVLVERFVAERFLVADKGPEGTAMVAVAHEALLRVWNRAAHWVGDNREFLRVRARVAARMKEGSRLLEGDPLLEAARHQLAAMPGGFTAEQAAFINECAQAVRHARERRERLRRQVMGVLSVLLLLALAGAGAALAKKREAERAREQAEGLIRFMVYDLRDKLAPLGYLDLMNSVNEHVDAYYEHLGRSDSPGGEQRRAAHLINQGDSLEAQGNLAGALQRYRQSLDLRRKLAAQDPRNAEWQRDLSVSLNKVGDAQKAQDDLAGALRSYRQSVDIMRKLAAQDPKNAEWQRDLSVSLDKVGDMQQVQSDLAGALQSYGESLDISRRLAAQDPKNAGWQRDLTVSLNKVGEVQQAQGDLAGALESYRESLDIRRRLAAQDPKNAVWQRDLSVSLNRVGEVQKAQDDWAGALQSYRESLAIMRKLAAQDPKNAGWQCDLSVSLDWVGDVQQAQSDWAGALQSYREGLDIRRKLAAQDPKNADWPRDLSLSLGEVGDVQKAQDDLPGALQSYRESLAIMRKLAAQDPKNAGWQRDLSVSLNNVGDAQQAQGDWVGALQSYRESLAIMRRLAAQDLKNAGWQRDLRVAYEKLGRAASAQGNRAEALQCYRASASITQNLVENARAQTNAESKRTLALELGSLAWYRELCGEFPEALKASTEAMTLSPSHGPESLALNYAHALLFSGQYENAKGIYMKFKGQKQESGKRFEDIAREDFRQLRQARQNHPDMEKIEALLRDQP
jgi:tetratricopeptide (TPR) repeat protein/energy-coupling factor transporter ATP-binding protein EcfA2